MCVDKVFLDHTTRISSTVYGTELSARRSHDAEKARDGTSIEG